MKNLTLIIPLFLISVFSSGQNPYKSLGIPDEEVKMLTLSQGRYVEFHEYKDFERIGNAIIDMRTNKIVSFIDRDTIRNESFYEIESSTRFFTMDRFSEKYVELTPYQYAGNNPILNIDVNGDSINVSLAQVYDGAMGTNHTNTLETDLESKTGLDLSINVNGKFEYATDADGKAIIARDADGKKVGSRKARKILTKAIEHTDDINISLGGANSVTAGNDIRLSPTQIGNFITGTSADLNNTTLGWGMTALHEIKHTNVGGGIHHGAEASPGNFGLLGKNVRIENTIRRQLGGNYGKRTSYQGIRLAPGGPAYIPMSTQSRDELQRGIVPANSLITF